MAEVALEHVEKFYPGGTHALSDFTLTIADGELLVLVGPSGCGKSTLLRLVAGLDEVSAGTLRIGDRVVNDLPPQERNVAMVFQDYALYPFMSVRGNLTFPLKMRKLPRQEVERRVDWVAKLLDIGHLLDRLPKQLSGGQRQRVAMGRALVREPTVFLLDEPLSNLDAKLRVQVRAEIGELQRRMATTMLYVTHDQVEAMTLGQRVAVLKDGRLQQVATPQELYDRPANVFVAGFIGNPPMNVFPVLLTSDLNARAVVRLGEFTLPLAPQASAASLDPDATFMAGIRPEAFKLATSDRSTGSLVTTVEHVEYLGHETLAHVSVPQVDDRLVVRLNGMVQLTRGDTLRLQVDPERIHLFDRSGRSVEPEI